MKLPVDTSAIAFLCALEPQPLLIDRGGLLPRTGAGPGSRSPG